MSNHVTNLKRFLSLASRLALAFAVFAAILLALPAHAYATPGVDDYPSQYKSAAKDALVDSWNFYNRECTSFVAWRLNNDNGVAFTNQYAGQHWGNANHWITAARAAGITVDSNPAVGAVACWTSGTYGHVAWVKSVSGNNVTIEEYNYNSNGAYNQRTIAKSNPSGYIHIKDLAATSGRNRVNIDDGYYIVQSAVGSCFLDVANGSADNGANVRVFKPNGSAAQIFHIGWNSDLGANYIQLRSSGKFVDTTGNAVGQANVQQWEGTGAEGQNWWFEDAGDGWYYIRNLWGYYLDVAGGVSDPGTNVQTYAFNGTAAQKWRIARVSGSSRTFTSSGSAIEPGYFCIQSALGTRFIDIANGSSENGANAQIWDPNGSAAQIFYVGWNQEIGASYIRLSSSGKYLDTTGNKVGQANVQQWEGTGANGQNWFLEDAGDGWYYIRNLWGYYLDVTGGVSDAGTNIQTYAFNGTAAQKWRLKRVSGVARTIIAAGYYHLQSASGGLVLGVADSSAGSGTNVLVSESTGSDSQVFGIGVQSSIGTVGANYLKLYHTSEFVTTQSNTNGPANVQLWDGNGSEGQNWWFEDAGDGWYYLRNIWGYYLEADGGIVRVAEFTGGSAQKWRPAVATVPMYRLYNQWSGEHLFTTDASEYESLAAIGWSQEGVAWQTPKQSSRPVYRLYNRWSGDHFYTGDWDEYQQLGDLGWNQEGVAFYSDDAEGVPIYRLFNQWLTAGTHLFTTDRAEYDHLCGLGWSGENVAFYGVA